MRVEVRDVASWIRFAAVNIKTRFVTDSGLVCILLRALLIWDVEFDDFGGVDNALFCRGTDEFGRIAIFGLAICVAGGEIWVPGYGAAEGV